MRAVTCALIGAVALVAFPAVAQNDAKDREQTSGAAAKAEPVAQSRVEKLGATVDATAEDTMKIMIRARQLQYRMPRAAADEDEAGRAERQRELGEWVVKVDTLRSEFVERQGQLNELRAEVEQVRQLDLSDPEIERLTQIEPGVRRISEVLEGGVRELDSARRKAVEVMDDPPKAPPTT